MSDDQHHSTQPAGLTPARFDPPDPYAWAAALPPPRPRFQHRYPLHIALFLATFLTTTYYQSFFVLGMAWGQGIGVPAAIFGWPIFLQGLWYSLPLLTILACHEFGHYFYCRKHNVDATLPYFLPAPFLLTGTFGAVIRIKERIPTKHALFDIGIAGPIAGFLALLPFLFWGLLRSQTASDGLRRALVRRTAPVSSGRVSSLRLDSRWPRRRRRSDGDGRLVGHARDLAQPAALRPARRRPHRLFALRQAARRKSRWRRSR